MRPVAPLEYTFICKCGTRYALGPSEYYTYLGQFFTCQCSTQTRLVDLDVLTYEIRRSNCVQDLLEDKTKE